MTTLARASLLPFFDWRPASSPPPDTVGKSGASAAFELVETEAGFSALEAEWSALFDRCAHPHQVFQSFEWVWTWHRLYGARATLAIVTGRREGRLMFVWPLVVRRCLGLRILTTMGEPVGQYADALIDPALPPADQETALAFVMALPLDVLALRRVRADASLAPLLRRRFGAPTNLQHAPFVDFAGAPTVEAFETRYSGKLRSSRRRHLRRLEEQGAVAFEQHGPSVQAVALVSTAMAFKRDWARRGKVFAPAIRDPRFERFFRAAANGEDRTPAIRISAVRCAQTVVGVEIAVACKGRLFGHVLAPKPGLEKLGIGGILIRHAITGALTQGFAGYDTLAPADAYKRDWTTTVTEVGDYHVGRGILGSLYVGLWQRWGRAAAKAILKTRRRMREI